ncbi:hypothetical protein K501DRAFT_269080 [Backusella circina FSU 941]|nr:hypothetical protein K501DRAFT_269080 [Backusella circina FSU 941]
MFSERFSGDFTSSTEQLGQILQHVKQIASGNPLVEGKAGTEERSFNPKLPLVTPEMSIFADASESGFRCLTVFMLMFDLRWIVTMVIILIHGLIIHIHDRTKRLVPEKIVCVKMGTDRTWGSREGM